jgi:hypothetical protein
MRIKLLHTIQHLQFESFGRTVANIPPILFCSENLKRTLNTALDREELKLFKDHLQARNAKYQ